MHGSRCMGLSPIYCFSLSLENRASTIRKRSLNRELAIASLLNVERSVTLRHDILSY
jgi:hypothetical protein